MVTNTTEKWKNKLKGKPGFILGNAPSLTDNDLTLLDKFFTVGINKTYLAYDPTILFWQDLQVWTDGSQEICQTKSMKVCRERASGKIRRDFYYFKLTSGKPTTLTDNPSLLHGRGITTKVAFQFVRALGCDPIIFLGTEGKYKGKKTDFYGINRHHAGRNNLTRFPDALKWIMKHNDKKIINCCNNKILGKQYTLEYVMNRLNRFKQSRKQWEEQLLKES